MKERNLSKTTSIPTLLSISKLQLMESIGVIGIYSYRDGLYIYSDYIQFRLSLLSHKRGERGKGKGQGKER